jgi:hypothetical protein
MKRVSKSDRNILSLFKVEQERLDIFTRRKFFCENFNYYRFEEVSKVIDF